MEAFAGYTHKPFIKMTKFKKISCKLLGLSDLLSSTLINYTTGLSHNSSLDAGASNSTEERRGRTWLCSFPKTMNQWSGSGVVRARPSARAVSTYLCDMRYFPEAKQTAGVCPEIEAAAAHLPAAAFLTSVGLLLKQR